MNNRLLIRLIDVALIILLGFVAISRLKTEYVALPSGDGSELQLQKVHETYLHVYQNFFKYEDKRQRWRCGTLYELEDVLIKQKNRFQQQQVKLIVNIAPHKSSVMQKLVDVIDICQRNNIEKSLNYEIYN